MEKEMLKDRVRGSLMSGAIGDALGYPVEFIYSYKNIQKKYGARGITRLDVTNGWRQSDADKGKAWVSDDTQMTLFTACGLVNARNAGGELLTGIRDAYVEWYYTQIGGKAKRRLCWISSIPELNQGRAPGTTCMSALESIASGKEPMNNSKGCGGVMRIAPIPLYGALHGIDIKVTDKLAADSAALTHLNPLGYVPAALLSHVISRLALDEQPTKAALKGYVDEGVAQCRDLFADNASAIDEFAQLVDKALRLADCSLADVDAIEEIGEGWVGDEAVAIALYCAVKHFDSFEDALIAAVNHKGDSDSTGAITGNALGAAVGYAALPQHFKDDVELHDVILRVADELV